MLSLPGRAGGENHKCSMFLYAQLTPKEDRKLSVLVGTTWYFSGAVAKVFYFFSFVEARDSLYMMCLKKFYKYLLGPVPKL